MFPRNFIIVAMTAMALLCPSLPCGECCATCPVVDLDVVENLSHSGMCCGHCQANDEKETFEHHSPLKHECPVGSEIVDCFCGGAVLASAVECPAQLLGVAFLSPLFDVNVLSLTKLSQPEFFSPNRCHFPTLSCGQDLCALIGSYLI